MDSLTLCARYGVIDPIVLPELIEKLYDKSRSLNCRKTCDNKADEWLYGMLFSFKGEVYAWKGAKEIALISSANGKLSGTLVQETSVSNYNSEN